MTEIIIYEDNDGEGLTRRWAVCPECGFMFMEMTLYKRLCPACLTRLEWKE